MQKPLRPSTIDQMKSFSQTVEPPLRPLLFDYPDDSRAWKVEDQQSLGSDLLVAPVLQYQDRTRMVYFPAGMYCINIGTSQEYKGGQHRETTASLDQIPVLSRCDVKLPLEA